MTSPPGAPPTTASVRSDAAAAVLGSLSPSRAGDFMTCPLLYRYRVIDKLPERPSPAAARGTVVHTVLERLFDLPATERTPERAAAFIRAEQEKWGRVIQEVGIKLN